LDEEDFLPEEEESFTDENREEDQQYEHYRFIADKGQNLLRIDKFLSVRIEGISRNRIQQAAEANCILVNGKAVKASYKVKPLDVISIVMDRPRRELEILPEEIPLNIVYEDETLMVINKPAGMVVHPGHGNYTGTLVNAVAYHLHREEITASTRTPRGCYWWQKLLKRKPISRRSSSTKRQSVSTWHWYGATWLRIAAPLKATSVATRKTGW